MNKFMKYNLEYISGRMSLRSPQKESLKILDNILNNIELSKNINLDETLKKVNSLYPTCSDFERKFLSLAFVLATGVGKTRLMGTFITYLYTNYNIKNFLVVAPNKTIYNKLKQDLGNPSNPKYVFKGIDCFVVNPPKIYSGEDYKNKNMELFPQDIKIYIYNIDKFNSETSKMKEVNEFLGASFFDELSKMEDLVIIMDESHHYHGEKGALALNELKPLLGLELTATPYYKIKSKQEKFKNAVYEYPLSKSIRDGYTRTPYAVTRQDINFYNFGEEELDKMMISDGIICHKKIKLELEYYAKNNGKTKVKPFMMIVCKDTEHANSIFEYITSDDFINGEYKEKTLVIHSNQSKTKREENVEKLLSVESYENPIEIVIHVDMLKEGWDVNNLYTIVPLRTASSKILREQMVGRGLRLPYGTRTGVKEIDSVMLTAHSKFDEILKEAQKGDSIFKEGNVIKVEEIEKENVSLAQLEIKFPKEEIKKICQDMEIEETVENEYFIEKTQENIKKEILEEIRKDEILSKKNINVQKIFKKIKKEINNEKDLSEVYNGNNKTLFNNFIENQIEEIVTKSFEKFIPIPQIKVNDNGITEYKIVDFDLELEEFNHIPIENDLIIQNLKDMKDIEIINNENKYISFSDFNSRKELITELRKKPEIDYENYSELLFKLIDQVLNHYRNKYNENEVKNIIFMNKIDIVNKIYNQILQDNHFYVHQGMFEEEVIDVKRKNIQPVYKYSNVKKLYEDPEKHKLKETLFINIEKGVFSQAKFDSEPELKFARIIERDKEVKNWLRPSTNELNIYYNRSKRYEPDFIVETEDCIYLIEVKGEDKINNADVISKKERGIEYCKIASKFSKANNYKKWEYLFIPAGKIQNNSSFKMLKENFIEK